MRYAVVTGGNKGIGFEICKQLAWKGGVLVVFTARDEKKGTEAVEKLRGCGLADRVVFHRVDVMDPHTINSLVDFIKTQFGRLDILVNNAGISGTIANTEALRAAGLNENWPHETQAGWREIMKMMMETYETAVECIQTNYYGAKRMTEALIPLLKLSESSRIVNVSSSMGTLQSIRNKWAKGVLGDGENLTEARVEEVLNQFLRDFEQGLSKAKGWPTLMPAYSVSKAALNAYTRIAAKKHPAICINCVCPGFVRTDQTFNFGDLSAEEGAASPVRLALQPHGGPSGLFFICEEVSSF
ncbi:(+)-neomenthol dehydrogenase-like [Diospyros lotus]|uniref:(+)-neomenthol dehydrogenase-like n=1 Tax=Diospyros lotus TaxID=55363 RepID=UPI00225B1C76|nr:(+)-neomenthol dehydrogenase-like [Diospyros lotus]